MTQPHAAAPPQTFARVAALRLHVAPGPWPYATANATAIRRHWQARAAGNPSFYDGEVFVLRRIAVEPGIRAEGVVSRARFSDFLLWRDGIVADTDTLDGFASAVVRSADGHVLLGQAAPATLNAGAAYLPGGFIDPRDARPDGTIDVEGAVTRELAEETGLDPARLERLPGFIVARHGRHCCLAIEYRSAMAATELQRHVGRTRHQGGTPDELSGVLTVGSLDELARSAVGEHARFVVAAVLGGA